MDKGCDTCLYGIRVEDNKLGCLYSGICHTQDGEKTAWSPKKAQCETVHVLHNYHMPETTRAVRQPEFTGPSCARCHHRFGTTSNAAWCKTHWQQSRCYRFKLEKR